MQHECGDVGLFLSHRSRWMGGEDAYVIVLLDFSIDCVCVCECVRGVFVCLCVCA